MCLVMYNVVGHNMITKKKKTVYIRCTQFYYENFLTYNVRRIILSVHICSTTALINRPANGKNHSRLLY